MENKLLLWLSIVIIFITSCQNKRSKEEVELKRKAALKLHNSANFRQAILEYDTLISIVSKGHYPIDTAELYYMRGSSRMSMTDHDDSVRNSPSIKLVFYNEALKDFNAAINIDSTHELAFYERGLVYINRDRNYMKAKEEFSKAINLNPRFYKFYFFRSYTNYWLEVYDQALLDINRAIVLNNHIAINFYQRGLIKIKMIEKYKLTFINHPCEDFKKSKELGNSIAQEEIDENCGSYIPKTSKAGDIPD
jgi:tetratricopeptide (TPR) repeat protein